MENHPRYHSLKTNTKNDTHILTSTNYPYSIPKQKKPTLLQLSHQQKQHRTKSQLNTQDYQRSLRRAFAKAKLTAFFNPDLTHFITLTYKKNHQNPHQTIQHIKDLIKFQKKLQSSQKTIKNSTSPVALSLDARHVSPSRGSVKETPSKLEPQNIKNQYTTTDEFTKKATNPGYNARKGNGGVEKALKYIYVMELQKRGAIHVHMIANEWFVTEMRNNHLNVKGWSHGFSDVKTIQNFDNNFKPYLYLFKYMTKAERVGDTFLHTSKTFDKIIDVDYDKYYSQLMEDNLLFTEDYEFEINGRKSRIIKQYFKTSTNSGTTKENTI